MKLLTIVYDAAVDGSLTELLEEMEVSQWTKSFGLFGQGETGSKLNTTVWPGINNEIRIAGDEAYLKEIASNIRELQDEFKLRPGILMLLQEVEEV